MPEIKVRVVDCYVYHQMDGAIQFLILKRNKDKLYEHLWQGVAGKIEKGEKAWQTAIRELKEETALNPKKMFIADHVSHFYETHGDRINLVPVFGIEVDSKDVILSDEHIELVLPFNIAQFRDPVIVLNFPAPIKLLSSVEASFISMWFL